MKKTARVAVVTLAAIVTIAALLVGESQKKVSRAPGLDPKAVKAINEVGGDLEKLNESHSSLMQAVGGLDELYLKLSRKGQEVCRLAADGRGKKGDPAARLLEAAREMEKMQQSFNLQYLQIQNKISHENRQFSMVSNIMKTKHDTAKNSINNIR
jgi:hypothetical protein